MRLAGFKYEFAKIFVHCNNHTGFRCCNPEYFAVFCSWVYVAYGLYIIAISTKPCLYFFTDADINNGALKSDVNIDPWVVSVGLGRKF